MTERPPHTTDNQMGPPTERLVWERDGLDWPNRAASRFVTAPGATWHVQRMGAGPVLLLLHGTGASTHSWRALAPLLSRYFDVVAPDLPGHAFTGTPSADALTLPGMARAVRDLMTALGITPALVVGHSAGAAIAARMSLDGLLPGVPILALNGALLPFPGIGRHVMPSLAKLLYTNSFAPKLLVWRARDPRAVANLIEGTGSRIDAEGMAIYVRLFQTPSHVAATLAMMARWDLLSLEADLHRLQVPLVLIVGGRDRAIAAEHGLRVGDLVASARSHYVRAAGHLAHEEMPDEIAAIVVAEARRLGVLGAE